MAVILGSGLGPFTEILENRIVCEYSKIPNFPQATVKGHAGELVFGKLGNTKVLAFRGRFHAYEGHPLSDVVAPVRLSSFLGVKQIIMTNASGGINSTYRPGDLVYVTDHINMTGKNPLLGPNDADYGPRFPDMSEAYSKDLIQKLTTVATKENIELKPGVYAGVLGPTYETPAEVQMLKIVGGDLVGMSTVPEVIVANHMGMNVCCIACVTNFAAGIVNEKLNHDDVKDVAMQSMEKFQRLLKQFISELGVQ